MLTQLCLPSQTIYSNKCPRFPIVPNLLQTTSHKFPELHRIHDCYTIRSQVPHEHNSNSVNSPISVHTYDVHLQVNLFEFPRVLHITHPLHLDHSNYFSHFQHLRSITPTLSMHPNCTVSFAPLQLTIFLLLLSILTYFLSILVNTSCIHLVYILSSLLLAVFVILHCSVFVLELMLVFLDIACNNVEI